MSLLETASQKKYWRSLNDLADRPEFQDWMKREFPMAASELPESVSRRRWLQLMGASLALGGLTGCRWEAEEFAPMTVRPQNRTPGEHQSFASSWELSGVARPLTVTSMDGRPLKIEGNSEHPSARGGTSAFDQAMILSLYDPDRSDGLVERVRSEVFNRSFAEFEERFSQRLRKYASNGGQGLAIVHGRSSSLTRSRLQSSIRKRFPELTWCEYEPAMTGNETRGTQLAFGKPLRIHLDFSNAKIIVSLDADPLGQHPDSTNLIRQWADRRDPNGDWTNRLYAVESQLSLTGSNADHRLPLKSSQIPSLIAHLEQLISAGAAAVENLRHSEQPTDRFLSAVADDLLRHRGKSLLAAGSHQPPEIHARVLRLNQKLGNIGNTIQFSHAEVPTETGFADLVAAMETKNVDTLLMLDVNPAYGSPESARFRQALSKVELSIHAGLYRDETAELCNWHLPLSHPLESWGDSRTWDGTVTLRQPLIDPLFGGKSECELLSLLTTRGDHDGRQLVRAALIDDERIPIRDERQWRKAVHDGFVADSGWTPATVELSDQLDERLPSGRLTTAEVSDREGVELIITLDDSVYDGRFANNSWLQETPDSMTKLTWDNAAVMSTATAESLGLEHEQLAEFSVADKSITLPIFVLPGVAEGTALLSLGYGRTRAGHVGGMIEDSIVPVGVDVSGLLTESDQKIVTGAAVRPLSGKRKLATTQDHFAIDTVGLAAIGNRVGELIRSGSLEEYREHPDFAQHRGPHHPPLESMWEEKSYDDRAWGMAIDLNRCIGCNACTVACQSENNVPVVGREQVLAGREMHWLRVDRYFSGDPAAPKVDHQPLACHHCETAPCEQVCPVAATVHSDEGLNDMVYNRCVGTRYCANNCPYKVRRFNFFDYNAPLSEPGNELSQMILNPEVTVRSRGVMEKCTYCVQRIQSVKIDAKNERRPIEDGEIQPACQQACPAQAITFGDLNDPQSEVARLHADQRSYGMLAELNTKPRTQYLARIRNTHPWLGSASQQPHGAHHA